MPFPQFPISLQFIGRSLQPPKDGGSSQSSLCRVCVLQVAGHVHVDGKSPNLPIRHTSGRIYSASFSRLQPVMLGTETVGISSRVAVNRAAPKYIRISLPGTKLFPMSPSYRKQQLLDSASSDYLAPKNLFPPQCAWFSSALHKCERTHRMQSEQQLFHEATCRYSSCEPELQGLLVWPHWAENLPAGFPYPHRWPGMNTGSLTMHGSLAALLHHLLSSLLLPFLVWGSKEVGPQKEDKASATSSCGTCASQWVLAPRHSPNVFLVAAFGFFHSSWPSKTVWVILCLATAWDQLEWSQITGQAGPAKSVAHKVLSSIPSLCHMLRNHLRRKARHAKLAGHVQSCSRLPERLVSVGINSSRETLCCSFS